VVRATYRIGYHTLFVIVPQLYMDDILSRLIHALEERRGAVEYS
jgi:hypothetical protein